MVVDILVDRYRDIYLYCLLMYYFYLLEKARNRIYLAALAIQTPLLGILERLKIRGFLVGYIL